MSQVTKLRINGVNKGSKQYVIGMPIAIGKMLEEGGVENFLIEFTDEGILLRPIDTQKPDPVEAPSWLKKS